MDDIILDCDDDDELADRRTLDWDTALIPKGTPLICLLGDDGEIPRDMTLREAMDWLATECERRKQR